jgi:hypothetical protein
LLLIIASLPCVKAAFLSGCESHPAILLQLEAIGAVMEVTLFSFNSTEIVFMNAASPGGNIPNWLADSFVLDMPYHSLDNFRDMLKSTIKE